MNPPTPDASCDLCVAAAAERPPVGEWVHRSEHWDLRIGEGYEVPGWLVMQLNRHAEHAADLTDDEAADFGRCLFSTMAAVEDVVPCDRVYVTLQGVRYPHLHVLVTPRPTDVPTEQRGGAFVASQLHNAAPREAVATAARIARRIQR